MMQAYSQRLCPPYSGLAQVVESERARAVTMDGKSWEIHFMHAIANGEKYGLKKFQRSFRRVANIRHSQLARICQEGSHNGQPLDGRIIELAMFLQDVTLPFPVADHYEYWLLDAADESPLAMIFSCNAHEHIATFPERPAWTAMPASMMPIAATEQEQADNALPVNYRLECLINERAGNKPKARWFERQAHANDSFPPLLLCEDWQNIAGQALCQRYIERQSSRLLMLHGLEQAKRLSLEQAASAYALEVARFYPLYPAVADVDLMNRIRVEARMRSLTEEQDPLPFERRDGVQYI